MADWSVAYTYYTNLPALIRTAIAAAWAANSAVVRQIRSPGESLRPCFSGSARKASMV